MNKTDKTPALTKEIERKRKKRERLSSVREGLEIGSGKASERKSLLN